MKNKLTYSIALLSIIFIGILSSCTIKEDNVNKKTVVENCDIIGAGGYGAIYDISIDPFNDNIFAARCDMGGLYMSYDRGKNWSRHNFLGVLSDIEFDSENEGVMWVLGSGLYQSVDHGKSFDIVFPSKDSIIAHGSSYENTGEWLFTNSDYSPTSSLVSIAFDRKSEGKHFFVAQKIEFSDNDRVCIYQTKNGKDFKLFLEIPIYSYIQLEYDETHDCLLVVTNNELFEFDLNGKKVWSKKVNLPTQVNNVLSFDSYYNKDVNINTFAFSTYVTDQPHENTALYVTNDLRDETSYRDLIPLLKEKKLHELKRNTDNENYVSYEFYKWINNKPVTQSFDWEIRYVYIANEDCIYFYNECNSSLVDASGNPTGNTEWISCFFQYKNNNFKWIYGSPHFYAYDLENTSWQDYDSSGCCFGMSASSQDDDLFVFSTIGTVYYTEDGEHIYQRHCMVGNEVALTAKNSQGHEEPVNIGQTLKETTTNGLNVETTYKTITDPFDSNHLLMACTDFGLLQSFNGGKTWVRSLITWNQNKTESMSFLYRNTCYDVEFDQEKQGVVYALWSAKHDAPYFPDSSELYATGAFGVSYDGGISWTMHHIRENDQVLPYRMDVDYTKNGRDIYIATRGHGFFVTRDLGKTFTPMNNGIPSSFYFGRNQPAIFGTEILSCGGGLFAITGASSWAQKPNPSNPEESIYERALYKWNQTQNKFEEIPLPKEVACIRDIEYSNKEQCLYIGAIGYVTHDTHVKTGGGVYRYKDGVLTQIFDDSKFVWGLSLDSKGNLYATLFRGEIYKFVDNNSKPELLIDSLFHVLKDITFGANDNILYVSTFGGGMYRITLKEV